MGLRGPGAKPVSRPVDDQKKARPKRVPWEKAGLDRPGRVIAFIESLKITSGSKAGRPFKLRDWQKKDIRGVYGADKRGRRRVRQALWTLPRKNGKTALAAALALCHLVGPEAESRGQVYSAASDRSQAALIYREMKAMLREAPDLSGRCIIRDFNKQIEDVITGSIYEALSSDARKAHGLSASFVVCDELAQWRGRELYDNLRTSVGARAEPLMITISTQSADPHSVMSELTDYGSKVLAGIIEDETFYASIYSAPMDADPWAEETWYACNPALGDFRSLEDMRIAAAQAQQMPSLEVSFRLLYLNQPVDAEGARLFSRAAFEACLFDLELERYRGRPCWLAIDLSGKADLTALALVFVNEDGTLDVFLEYWTPAGTVRDREHRDRAPYSQWVRQGFMTAIPGNAIDYAWPAQRIAELAAEFDLQALAFDRWRIDDLEREFDELGIPHCRPTDKYGVGLVMMEHGQGFKDMAPAIDAMEAHVLNTTVRIHRNPVTTMCAANSIVIRDSAGNRKLDKVRSTGRIDGLVAAVMGVGLATKRTESVSNIYDTVELA